MRAEEGESDRGLRETQEPDACCGTRRQVGQCAGWPPPGWPRPIRCRWVTGTLGMCIPQEAKCEAKCVWCYAFVPFAERFRATVLVAVQSCRSSERRVGDCLPLVGVRAACHVVWLIGAGVCVWCGCLATPRFPMTSFVTGCRRGGSEARRHLVYVACRGVRWLCACMMDNLCVRPQTGRLARRGFSFVRACVSFCAGYGANVRSISI